ncbi:MAG: phosphodiester glycosidase family protein [Clostridia bacterium]|nr:phosphodiester glycosidase family protein [Clostridia bacterium]
MKKKNGRGKKTGAVIFRITVSVLTALVLIVGFILSGVAVINYGPSRTARDLFVVSMLETSAAKFLATWYFTPEAIDSILAENAVIADTGVSNPDLINIKPVTQQTTDEDVIFPGEVVIGDTDALTAPETTPPDTEPYETVTRPVTTEKPPEDDNVVYGDGLEIHDVSGPTFYGKMMIVYDPSRLFVGVSGDYSKGDPGRTIYQITKSYGATAALNGGGFEDRNGTGDGGIPIGLVITEGKLVWGNKSTSYEVIGFNRDNVFIVGTMTGQQALDAGIRDAIAFGPVLVMNGKASTVKGAGSGLNPRSAIGQRADGAVLLLAIDGRRPDSLGATYADLIDIMLEFGAVNAANLDGGNSTGLVYKGSLVNKGLFFRGLPTCFLVR